MRLSAPIYKLKRQARLMSRADGIPLNAALEQLAAREGFRGWHQLAKQYASKAPAPKLYAQMKPGEMILVAARPGHGKTVLGCELAQEAARHGRASFVFSLDFNDADVRARLDPDGPPVSVDCSDDIWAETITERMGPGAFAVIDYLQLLDQRRDLPALDHQMRHLGNFARTTGAGIVAISQIDRRFDVSDREMPGLTDIRMPNRFDLKVFDRACFLHKGEISVAKL